MLYCLKNPFFVKLVLYRRLSVKESLTLLISMIGCKEQPTLRVFIIFAFFFFFFWKRLAALQSKISKISETGKAKELRNVK